MEEAHSAYAKEYPIFGLSRLGQFFRHSLGGALVVEKTTGADTRAEAASDQAKLDEILQTINCLDLLLERAQELIQANQGWREQPDRDY
ncbi:MAG: hypothetical protein HOO67_01700 [Candidatus Peribacteraceae bacterium]|nr:hypothetical protein [Candidatus Peribacteraceae bacterium]